MSFNRMGSSTVGKPRNAPLLSGFQPPEARDVFLRGGDDARPVRAECPAVGPIPVPLEGGERGLGCAIPHVTQQHWNQAETGVTVE